MPPPYYKNNGGIMAATMFTPFEPKTNNRFILYIDGIESYLINTTSLPSIENGEIKIEYINVDFKVKSKSTWSNIDITMYDPIDPTGAAMVHDWLDIHHKSDNGVDGYAFDEYKKDIDLKYLDPKGQEFQGWKIYGAFMTSANWGSMDWAGGDSVSIDVSLAYDYARVI
jgi:hypothetical protein